MFWLRRMLAGLMSRWTTPYLCMYARPRQTLTIMSLRCAAVSCMLRTTFNRFVSKSGVTMDTFSEGAYELA